MLKRVGLFVVIIVLMIFAIPTSLADSPCDSETSHLEEGMDRLSFGDTNSAITYFECALLNTPDDSNLLTMLSNIYANMGDIHAADYYANRLQSLMPPADSEANQVPVLIQMAQTYVDIEDFDTALVYLNQAIQIDDEYAVLYSYRGYMNYKLDRLQEALIDLNVAIELNPDVQTAYQTRQLVLEALAQNEVVSVASPVSKNALPQLDDNLAGEPITIPVAETAPSSPTAESLRQAAHKFFGLAEFELAIQEYEALLAFEPHNAEIHFNIGYSYYALKNPSQALVYLRQALDLQPDHLYAKYLQAMSYSMMGMHQNAMNSMVSIYESNQFDRAFPIAMGHVYRNLGHVDAAGVEFHVWLEQVELLRIEIEPPVDRTPMNLVMDYGVVYEIPFHAVAGNTIQISVESYVLNPSPIDPLIVILNEDGIPVAGDDDHGELFDSILNFVPPYTGTYTLLVSHAGGNSQGDLTLTMTGLAWSADTFRQLGQLAIEAGNYQRGIEMISKAITLDGGTYQDHMRRAYAFRQIDAIDYAISDYYKALESSPYPEEVYANLGQLYRSIDDLDSAAVAYIMALDIDPRLDAVRCDLGMIYAIWGDHHKALAEFDTILAYNVSDPCAHANRDAMIDQVGESPSVVRATGNQLADLGYEYLSQGKLFTTAFTFRQVLSEDPTLDSVRCELGKIYLKWGNYIGALEHFDKILEHDSTNLCALEHRSIAIQKAYIPRLLLTVNDYVYVANIYISIDEWDLAIESLETAIRLDPSRSDVRCELGKLYYTLGDSAGASEQFNKALEHNTTEPCARGNQNATIGMVGELPSELSSTGNELADQGYEYLSQGKLFATAFTFRQVLSEDPTLDGVRCELGKINLKWGNYIGALEHFDKILEHDSTNSCALEHRSIAIQKAYIPRLLLTVNDYVYVANIYTSIDEWELAVGSLETALQINPLRSDIRCELGKIYVTLEHYSSALEQFDIILSQHIIDSCAISHRDALLKR